MTTDPLALVAAMPMPIPAGFRTRYRSEPGMIGHYPWTYADQRRRSAERPSTESEDLFTADQYRAARLEAAQLVLAQGEPVAYYAGEHRDGADLIRLVRDIPVNTALYAAPAAPVNAELTNRAGAVAIECLNKAFDTWQMQSGRKADLIGFFCNEWNAALASAEAASREAT